MNNQFYRIVMRIAFFVYFSYLTILLLSQDPTRWIGTSSHLPEFIGMLMPLAHLISFAVLSLLTFAACLPIPWWSIMFLLAVYGGATEIIQAAIPHRTPDWADWAQDLGGIAFGFACFCLAVILMRTLRRDKNVRIPASL